MNHVKDYDRTLLRLLASPRINTNKRTGKRTRVIHGVQCRYDISDGRIPLITKRELSPRAMFAELCWFLEGSTSVHRLRELGCGYWDQWADERGALGPVYGAQLRNFNGDCEEAGDQLQRLLDEARRDPSSRRLMWSLWNPLQIDDMALPPCHYAYQVCIDDDGRMTGVLTQRSADWPVGVPTNIVIYSAITQIIAHQVGAVATELVHHCGDAHMYEDQEDGVVEYLTRDRREEWPELWIQHPESGLDYHPDMFKVHKYTPLSRIQIPVAR